MPDGHELRCACRRNPLLATWGLDTKGQPFVHVKVWKQRRIFGEIIVTGGTVQLLCRECYRWHRVHIKQPNEAKLVEQNKPDEIATQEASPTVASNPLNPVS